MLSALTPTPSVPRRARPPWLDLLARFYPLVVVLGALAWAMVSIALRRTAEEPAGIKTIHFAHYQLEAGVREGLVQMAKAYEKLHPDVRIVQDWVPSNGYGQWLSTQLVSGHPADIVESGGGLPEPVWLSYKSRYFLPLTDRVQQPNPYNEGTELAGLPWMQTYFDQMKLSRVPELQQYMAVPLAQFGVRVLYNKPLLKRLTGLDTPPQGYPEFLAACERIKAQSDSRGRPYSPIAGSTTHFPHWVGSVAAPLTFPLVQTVDFNHDGYTDSWEVFAAYKCGLLRLDAPELRARFRVVRQLADECQPGFTGANRDEAVSFFIQQRVVFMSAGSWEALSLIEQARDSFEVGIADFPHPANSDPGFAGLAPMPPVEIPSSNFLFYITRASRYPEVAVDFMQFLSSRRINEELNRIIGWIPCIVGAKPNGPLAAFAPHLRGIAGLSDANFYLGGDTQVYWSQQLGLFNVNQSTYEQFAADYGAYYGTRGANDFRTAISDQRRAQPARWRGNASQRELALDASTPQEASKRWTDYANAVTDQTLRAVSLAYDAHLVAAGFPAGQSLPGRYSPEALAAIRQRVHTPPPPAATATPAP